MKYVPGQETKKSLGQHWLHDDDTLDSIVAAAEISSDDSILEIGPGLGTLTEKLINTNTKVLALEFDQGLISSLEKKFANCKKFAIRFGDIRQFNYSEMPKNFKVVANIPYYLTSNLIRSISETSNQPEITVILIQKEVAQRICAKPGQMGILSVTAQFYFKCSLDVEVPAELFTPPPKVDSQVVKLVRRENKLFDIDERKFFNLVKAGFSEKRKTLRNSLSGGLGISKEEAVSLLEKAKINPLSRAQELSLDEWHNLYVELRV